MNRNTLYRFCMPNTTGFAYPFHMIPIPQNQNARMRVFLPLMSNSVLTNNAVPKTAQNLNKVIDPNATEERVLIPFTPNSLFIQNNAQNLNKGNDPDATEEQVLIPFTPNSLFLQNNIQNLNKVNDLNATDERVLLPFTPNSLFLRNNAQNLNKVNSPNDIEERMRILSAPNSSLNQNDTQNQDKANNPNDAEQRVLLHYTSNSTFLQNPNKGNNISDVDEIVPDFKCEVCECRIPTYTEFVKHITFHEKDSDDKSSSSVSSSDDNLFLTLAKGTSGNKETAGRIYSCPYCERIFKCYTKLEAHMGTHEKKKKIECTICKATFSSESSVRKHQMMLHCTSKVRRQCTYCVYRCFQSSDMEKHIARKHTGNFKFKCSLCIKGFTTPKELNNHMRRKHPNAKNATISNAEKNKFGFKICKSRSAVEEGIDIEKGTDANSAQKPQKNYSNYSRRVVSEVMLKS